MKTVSMLVAAMLVLAARAGAEEPNKKRADVRWELPPRLAPDDCNPGQSHAPPDANRWTQYGCWCLRNRWLIVYAAYATYEQAKKCIATNPPSAWAQMMALPGFLFSGFMPAKWYCLDLNGVDEVEGAVRKKLADYKGLTRREHDTTVELRKEEAVVRRTTYLPLMDRTGHAVKPDDLDFRVMNERVMLTFRYNRRPGYVPQGKEKKCPLPFHGTVASFGPSRRQIASATFSTDGIDLVNFGNFKDGSYLLEFLDGRTKACRPVSGGRTHFLVWSPQGALLDWKTFPGQSEEWQDYSRPPNPLTMCIASESEVLGGYGVKWDGKRLKRVEGKFCDRP